MMGSECGRTEWPGGIPLLLIPNAKEQARVKATGVARDGSDQRDPKCTCAWDQSLEDEPAEVWLQTTLGAMTSAIWEREELTPFQQDAPPALPHPQQDKHEGNLQSSIYQNPAPPKWSATHKGDPLHLSPGSCN